MVFYSAELLENADNLIYLTVLERKYIINKCIFLGVWSVKMKIELMYLGQMKTYIIVQVLKGKAILHIGMI